MKSEAILVGLLRQFGSVENSRNFILVTGKVFPVKSSPPCLTCKFNMITFTRTKFKANANSKPFYRVIRELNGE